MSNAMLFPTYTVNINGAIITNDVLDCDINVLMNTSFEPDSFTIKLYNVDQLVNIFIVRGSLVTITVGYQSGIVSNLLTGIITNITYEIVNDETVTIIEGIDYIIYNLKQTEINLTLNVPTDIVEIIRQICFKCGVTLNILSIPSGIILPNYTISNTNGFDEIKKLNKRLNYVITSKSSLLYISKLANSGVTCAYITDQIGFKLSKMESVGLDGNGKVNGYNFYGAGIPTLLPTRLVTVAFTEDGIFGNYLIENVKHTYNCKTGYVCSGSFIDPFATVNSINNVGNSTVKTLAAQIGEKIKSYCENLPSIDTGILEQGFSNQRTLTAKYGMNNEKNKTLVNPSVEANIGENNVFLVKKPVASSFAGNGFGLITPFYPDMRPVIAFNRFDKQDANILGFLWKKGWVIPQHDDGDIMIHHKNHSKFVMKEDGHSNLQFKGLKIEIGSNGLTNSKPTKTDDGKYIITFDDGSELSYKNGTGWLLKTSGNIVIDGSSIKLGESASKGTARLDDGTISNATTDSAFWIWLNGLYVALTAWVPTIDPMDVTLKAAITALGAFPTSLTGKINQASSKVKNE